MSAGTPPAEHGSRAVASQRLDRLERALLVGILLLLLLIPLVFFSLQSWTGSYHVHYRVSGTARSVFISYRNARGGLQQREIQPPWQESFYAPWGSNIFLALQSVRQGEATCEIRVDQRRWRTNTRDATSQRSVSCQGTLGTP